MISSKRAVQIFWWPFFALTVSVSIRPASSSTWTLVATVDCGSARKRLMSLTLSGPLTCRSLRIRTRIGRGEPLEDLDIVLGVDGQEVWFHREGGCRPVRRPRIATRLYQRLLIPSSGRKQDQRNGMPRKREIEADGAVGHRDLPLGFDRCELACGFQLTIGIRRRCLRSAHGKPIRVRVGMAAVHAVVAEPIATVGETDDLERRLGSASTGDIVVVVVPDEHARSRRRRASR